MASRSRFRSTVRALRRFERQFVPAVVSATRAACGGLREILKELTFLLVSAIGLIAVLWWVLSRVPWTGS